MKMHTSLLMWLFFPLFGLAQKGKEVTLVKTDQAVVATESQPLFFSGLPTKTRLAFSFSMNGSELFLTTSGAGWGASTIDIGDELILRFSNDSTVRLHSAALQSIEPDPLQNTYKHRYILSEGDLDALQKFTLVGIRKYSFNTSTEIKIPKENSEKLKRRTALFLADIGRTATAAADADRLIKNTGVFNSGAAHAAQVMSGTDILKQINVKEIGNHIGDSVAFCSKVYKVRYFPESEGGPTVLDVQADFYDPVVNLVIWGKYRDQFRMAPEKLYANKEVCISGVVELRNNIPSVNIRNLEQIRLKGDVSLSQVGTVVGDSVTVLGQIFTASYPDENGQRPTLLSVGAPFPQQTLTLVIRDEDREKFGIPEALYLNRLVRVSGRVTKFYNQPRMLLYDKKQVEVLMEDTSAAITFAEAERLQPSNISTNGKRGGAVQKSAGNLSKESIAEFPGGDQAFMVFLAEKLVTPSELLPGEEKAVVVSFDIDANGACKNIKIVESAGYAYDQEVKRVLLQMPKWKPAAAASGSSKSSRLTQTVRFKGSDGPAQKAD